MHHAGVDINIETLLEYERRSAEIGASFDFIIADPFQKSGTDSSERSKSIHGDKDGKVLDELIDEKGVTLYLQSAWRLLRRGAYLFVFLGWDKLQQ